MPATAIHIHQMPKSSMPDTAMGEAENTEELFEAKICGTCGQVDGDDDKFAEDAEW